MLVWIRLVIDQLPRTAVGSRNRITFDMLLKSSSQIRRVADVKSVIAHGAEYINVVHQMDVTPGA